MATVYNKTHRSQSSYPWLSIPWLFCTACLLLLPGTASVAATLQISELEDIEFGEVPTNARRVSQRMRFCVSMTPAGPYQLTAVGTTSGRSFAMLDADGVAAPIRFDVQASRGLRGRRTARMQPGIALRNLRGFSPRPDGSCRRRGQIEIQVRINPQDLAAAAIGRYQGRLQLTVAPE